MAANKSTCIFQGPTQVKPQNAQLPQGCSVGDCFTPPHETLRPAIHARTVVRRKACCLYQQLSLRCNNSMSADGQSSISSRSLHPFFVSIKLKHKIENRQGFVSRLELWLFTKQTLPWLSRLPNQLVIHGQNWSRIERRQLGMLCHLFRWMCLKRFQQHHLTDCHSSFHRCR